MTPRLVPLPHAAIHVGQQPEVEALLPSERQVDLGWVEGGAKDLGAGLLELGGSIPEPLALPRSPGRGGLDEPPHHHPSSPEVGQRNRVAVLIRQGEVGGRGSLLEHEAECRPACATLAAMVEVSDWARDILTRSHHAARRFTPGATIRLARIGGQVEATLAEAPEAGDQPVDIGDVTVYVESGLEGLVDVEEPHDRLVLKPPGSAPNARGDH